LVHFESSYPTTGADVFIRFKLHDRKGLKILLIPPTRGVFREGFCGSKPLPFLRNFFNLLGFFKKKNPKTPPKFSLPYKKFQNPSLKKFLDTPMPPTTPKKYFLTTLS